MILFREITPSDNKPLAKIIRDNLKTNHLDIPGTVYFDSNLDHLSDYYLTQSNKLAKYIKKFFKKYKNYPDTTLYFYKFGRVIAFEDDVVSTRGISPYIRNEVLAEAVAV